MEEYVKISIENYHKMLDDNVKLMNKYSELRNFFDEEDKLVKVNFYSWDNSWVYSKDEATMLLVNSLADKQAEIDRLNQKLNQKWYKFW